MQQTCLLPMFTISCIVYLYQKKKHQQFVCASRVEILKDLAEKIESKKKYKVEKESRKEFRCGNSIFII